MRKSLIHQRENLLLSRVRGHGEELLAEGVLVVIDVVHGEEVLLTRFPRGGDADLLLDPSDEGVRGLVLIKVPDDLLLEKVWEQADDCTFPPLVVHRVAAVLPVSAVQAVPALYGHRHLAVSPALLGVHD